MRSRSHAVVGAVVWLMAVLAVGSARRSWTAWAPHTEGEVAAGQTRPVVRRVPLWGAAGVHSADNPYRRENHIQTAAVAGLAVGAGLVAFLALTPRRRGGPAADYREGPGGAVPDGRAEPPSRPTALDPTGGSDR